MSPLLAASSALLAFAAAWELAGLGPPPALARAVRAIRSRLGARPALGGAASAGRLRRAGLDGRVSPRAFLAAKGACAAAGALCAAAVLPVTPGRLAPIVLAGLPAAGFLAPDAMAERLARLRGERISAALPDALDVLAVGAGAGRSPVAMLAELAAAGGPLGGELAIAVAEIEAGAPRETALAALRERTGLAELGMLAATLERSRRHGSPLAEQLHAQAAALRADERRRTEERAARAAPKIQLVVALLLVPSALLAIAAALVAHSGSLFAAIGG